MGIEEFLPDHNQDEINPEKPGDYVKDGILYCGVCGEPKQHHVVFGDLDKMVPCVCRCVRQEEEARNRRDEYNQKMLDISRLRDASMMAGKFRSATFKDYVRRPENEPAYNAAVNYCRRWQEMKTKNQGLLFYGPVGTGKSHTAACIANCLLEQDVPVIMTSFVKILQDIRAADDEGAYIGTLNAASLLIIDDLGAERSTDYALEKVYNVIDSRVRADKPMILTTNLDLAQMMNCDDIRYKRIYDRIFEVCFPIEIAGRSFREEKASRRFEEMKDLLYGGGTDEENK